MGGLIGTVLLALIAVAGVWLASGTPGDAVNHRLTIVGAGVPILALALVAAWFLQYVPGISTRHVILLAIPGIVVVSTAVAAFQGRWRPLAIGVPVAFVAAPILIAIFAPH
jgi:hypothetical protein